MVRQKTTKQGNNAGTPANVIVMPDIYEKYRRAVLEPRFLRVSGIVQNQDGIVHLRAANIEALMVTGAEVASHDSIDSCAPGRSTAQWHFVP